ncbi:DegT/DnrJ/EryC1/StrS family aminotransferase [Flavivirga algicola]|uniref:DegT/DnrJ/EryC1/StrS aminotransferase family protein n=1 Tax=Flavivirga algicola TaxID=2729136 RepID=A0ABX1S129_9FLAO|nr:DegT/DnrJ/EryC1/StrS family aminotransferase [Flavivirga algicola]NMH88327.1 hypothetical protein [Flavivirga algicola]
MIYWKGQIINPENFRVPSFYISPFNVKELSKMDKIKSIPVDNNDMVAKLNSRFGNNHEFLMNGKEAIYKALSFYNLNRNDEVYIVTSTGNKYVSSCVTNEIEKYCNWSRNLSDKTKLIFVIHEFGVVYEQMDELREINLPIVEDLAMSLFSNDIDNKAGTYGDFTVYSLPKFFPIQFGGVLRYNNPEFSDELSRNDLPFQIDLKKTSYFYLKKEKKIIKKRLANYNYYALKLNEIGLETRFALNLKETPSVYMFTTDSLNLDKLKIFMQKNGVECSVFYGENAFYIPVHQNLKKVDLDFIINLIKYFTIENQ